MVDAITGATYRDTARGETYLCNGIVERKTGDGYVVVLESIEADSEDTMAVPLDSFQTDPSFEVVELPF
jgi:hypothetical protein